MRSKEPGRMSYSRRGAGPATSVGSLPTKDEDDVATPTSVSRAEKLLATESNDLPTVLRFPLCLLLNLSLSALLYSLSTEFMAGDLSSASRSLNEWWQVGGLVLCKASEIALGWWGLFDGYDVASLTFISHFPTLFLLVSFYNIRPSTMIFSLAVDVLATYVPFRLLRPISAFHEATPPLGSVANRLLLDDPPLQAFASIFGAAVHGTVLYVLYKLEYGVFLADYFYGLRDLTAAHDSTLFTLIAACLPLGFAAKIFLFTPAIAAKPDNGEARAAMFDAEEASLAETILHNFWGYSSRVRTLIKRTAALAVFSFFNTWLQVWVTIEGVEGVGAAGWAGVWASAVVLIGLGYGWIGNADALKNMM